MPSPPESITILTKSLYAHWLEAVLSPFSQPRSIVIENFSLDPCNLHFLGQFLSSYRKRLIINRPSAIVSPLTYLDISQAPVAPACTTEPMMATMANSDRELTQQPQCQNCATSTTPLWRRDEMGSVLCNACGLFLKLHGRPRPISLKTDVIKSRNRVKTMRPDLAKKKQVSSFFQHCHSIRQPCLLPSSYGRYTDVV